LNIISLSGFLSTLIENPSPMIIFETIQLTGLSPIGVTKTLELSVTAPVLTTALNSPILIVAVPIVGLISIPFASFST
jgi:hypothetical protein